MMKKSCIIILLVVVLVLSLAGCGNKVEEKKQELVGSWALLNDKGQLCPVVLTFNEDGQVKIKYDRELSADDGSASAFFDTLLESSGLSAVAEEYGFAALLKSDTVSAAVEKLSDIAKLTYQMRDNNKVDLTISLLFGAVNHSWNVDCVLDGNQMSFDGVNYQRIQ